MMVKYILVTESIQSANGTKVAELLSRTDDTFSVGR
jgi:hypothetical protein